MRIGFVTCSTQPEITHDDNLAAEALRRLGAEVAPLPWDDPTVNWAACDQMVLRSTWNYHLHPQAFTAWLDARQQEGARVWNPIPTLRWNMRKTYLRELSARGFCTPQTDWLERGAPPRLEERLRGRGWRQAVLKPIISASAYRTARISLDNLAEAQILAEQILQDGGAMLQEYRPEVAEDGEWSLIFYHRRFSHAVLKRSAAGDFRVQGELGGSEFAALPNTTVLREARRVLETVPGDLLYARVDGVQVEGRLMLIELELIEPALYLHTQPAAAAGFAAAVLRTEIK